MIDDDLAHWLREALAPLGRVRMQRMFGGAGLSVDGFNIAFLLKAGLYFKSDAITRPQFEAAGLEPFTYARRGKTHALSYHQAPPECFDDDEAALAWGRLALAAARRTVAAKGAKARK